MEQEKSMSNEESLRLIQSMIQSVKKDLEDDSFYYLFWGWLVFAASMGHFILLNIGFEHPEITWMLMPLGGIVSGVYGYKQNKERKAKSFASSFLNYLALAFVVSLFITLIFMQKLMLATYPIVMTLYAIFLFVSGGVLQFKPLKIGGIINWMLAVVAFYVSFEMQLLVLASAVLLGYIIPGYLLKSKYNKSMNPHSAVVS